MDIQVLKGGAIIMLMVGISSGVELQANRPLISTTALSARDKKAGHL